MVKKKAAPKASAPTEKTTTSTTTTAAPSPARGGAGGGGATAKASVAAPTTTRSSRSTAAAIPPELPKALTTTGASASSTAASGRATRGGGGGGKDHKEEEAATKKTTAAATTAPAGKKAKTMASDDAPGNKKAPAAKGKKGEAAEAAPAPAATSAPAPAMIYPVMGSPGIPTAGAAGGAPPGGAPQAGIAFTDQDILLPTTNEQIAARPANREYIQLLQANCAAFHSLPSNEQAWMLNNVCHFLTAVRKHRMLHYHPYYGWRVLTEPLPFVVAEMSLDTFKRAAFRFHPLWLLGDHDPSGYHRGTPFVHRKVTGAWRKASVDDVRMILQGEGLKNLLLLPTGMDFVDDASEGAGDDAASETKEVTESV